MNKSKKFFLSVLSIGIILFAQIICAANKPKKNISPEEFRKKYFEYQLKKTGGLTRAANSAKGTFVVLNSQNIIPTSEITSIYPMIDKWIRVQMAFKDVKKVEDVKADIVRAGGSLGVAVVDSDYYPGLLIAPEDGWAIVNVKKLNEKGVSKEVLSSRVRKEILRAFAFITGGAYTTKADPLMRDVKKPSDLDALNGEQFGLEIITKVLQSAPLYGLTPWVQDTYLNACQQGWAPAPTNEYQKAIWNKVRASPNNPMKIEFDPKKGR